VSSAAPRERVEVSVSRPRVDHLGDAKPLPP
jgi:hypothetical protein